MNCFRKDFIKKLLTTALAAGVLTITLFFFRQNIAKSVQKTQANRRELTRRSAEISSFAQLQSQNATAESYFNILKNVLPDRDQLFDFQKEMERLAFIQKISFIFSFGNETSPTADKPGSINFSLMAEGPRESIMQFIREAEKNRFLLNFKNFEFSEKTAKINGEVFFRQ